MWSSIINAVKSRLGLDNSENNTKLDNSGNRKQSILTGKVNYNNTGWRKDKASQASLQEDISKGRTVNISAPQSSRYSFDSEGVFDSKGVADLDSRKKDADDFKEISVDSTAVETIGYNPKNGNLDIQYTSGNTKYRYPNVPPEVVTEFLDSPSKGKYLYYVIRPKYSTAKH